MLKEDIVIDLDIFKPGYVGLKLSVHGDFAAVMLMNQLGKCGTR
jgi:hypothetical protein